MIDNQVEEIKKHVEEIMNILDIPVNNSTENTPLRIAKMWSNEVFANRNNNNIEDLNARMKVFDNVDDIHELVIVKDIPFSSMCEHHFMPFMGKITVGYVPRDKIIGLSKIPRAVKFFSKKPQLQERLVQEIAEYLYEITNATEIYVIARDTTHTCVLCRGVESTCDTDTIYSIVSGVDNVRQEFFERIR